MNEETFRKYNVAFTIDDCPRCRILNSFIERINSNLVKRIRIINCTYYQKYGIITDPLIIIFNKHFDGFPTLFIKGVRIIGCNSRIESEADLRVRFNKYFIIPETNEFIFNKECEYKRKRLLRRVICD